MLATSAVDTLTAVLLLAAWYWWFRRANRHRSVQILRWIEQAFSGHGSLSRVRWHGASSFYVDLRLCPSVFRRASLAVHLEPRQLPLAWLLNRVRKRKETVIFKAELDHGPSRNLHIQKHYWSGRTRRTAPTSLQGWCFETLTPILISTQPDWQRDSGHMVETLQTFARTCDYLQVAFRRQPPHFVVKAPLASLCPQVHEAGMFDVLHELASIASASTY
jgi:hypothetical protein